MINRHTLTHRPHLKWALLVLAVTGLFLSGCATLTVINDTNQNVRIVVHTPDSDGFKVSTLGTDFNSKTINSLFGGGFTVAVVTNQALITDLTIQKTS